MKFVREELEAQTAFTNYNFAVNLAMVAQLQTYLTLSGNLNTKTDFSEVVSDFDDHVKFLFDDNQIEEMYFLSKASKYLGFTQLGNKKLWKYIKSRFSRLSNAASPEQLCQFVEGVKRRGEKLSNYQKILELKQDIAENWGVYDFGIKVYVYEVCLLLEEDQEIQIDKNFEKQFCREFEQTDLAEIGHMLTLKKLKFICSKVQRLDVYEQDVEQIMASKLQ